MTRFQPTLDFVEEHPSYKTKMHSDDRILVIRVMEGVNSLNNMGLVDNRIFRENGGNQLHAIREPNTSLWLLSYEKGNIPPQLRMKFTSFNKMLTFVNHYYNKRNLEVVEIIG